MSKYNPEYHKAWYAKNRERLLVKKREYNAKYFAIPENAERRRKAALRPEQKALRKVYKTTEAGQIAATRYNNKPETKARKRELSQLRRFERYGLTPEATKQLQLAQNDQCGICTKPLNGRFHIDHNHTTGKVRGLLCTSCNMGLGLFQDNPVIMLQAIHYLSYEVRPDDSTT